MKYSVSVNLVDFYPFQKQLTTNFECTVRGNTAVKQLTALTAQSEYYYAVN